MEMERPLVFLHAKVIGVCPMKKLTEIKEGKAEFTGSFLRVDCPYGPHWHYIPCTDVSCLQLVEASCGCGYIIPIL
jgi:hypothetical protein